MFTKTISKKHITGKCSGDGESFFWEISKEEYIDFFGQEAYDRELELTKSLNEDLGHTETKFEYKPEIRACPQDLFSQTKLDPDKEYKFTMIVEELINAEVFDLDKYSSDLTDIYNSRLEEIEKLPEDQRDAQLRESWSDLVNLTEKEKDDRMKEIANGVRAIVMRAYDIALEIRFKKAQLEAESIDAKISSRSIDFGTNRGKHIFCNILRAGKEEDRKLKESKEFEENRNKQEDDGTYTDDGEVPVTCEYCGKLRPRESVSCCEERITRFKKMCDETAKAMFQDKEKPEEMSIEELNNSAKIEHEELMKTMPLTEISVRSFKEMLQSNEETVIDNMLYDEQTKEKKEFEYKPDPNESDAWNKRCEEQMRNGTYSDDAGVPVDCRFCGELNHRLSRPTCCEEATVSYDKRREENNKVMKEFFSKNKSKYE
jgi:hypothetical protein